jgi:hypothetical protein
MWSPRAMTAATIPIESSINEVVFRPRPEGNSFTWDLPFWEN